MLKLNDKISELACISTAILKAKVLPQIIELEPDDFYFQTHRIIFENICELYKLGEQIDLTALRNCMIRNGVYNTIGGDNYFLVEFSKQGSVVNIESVVEKIKDLSNKRKLCDISLKLKENSQNIQISTDEILNNIETELKNINNVGQKIGISAAEIANIGVEEYNIDGCYYPTGLIDLDDMIIGLFKSELIIIGARTGVGKSALALNFALKNANKHNVLFFSLEMKVRQIGLRIVSYFSQLDSDIIRRGEIASHHKEKIVKAQQEIKKLNLIVYDDVRSLKKIYSIIKKTVQNNDIGLVVIDYLQLVRTNSKESRHLQVGEICRSFKDIAMEFDIPVIALSQLNRNADEQRPKLSDLRESGDIEHHSDVVLFLHEDSIIVSKNRSGRLGSLKIVFEKKYSKFLNAIRNYSDFENNLKF